MTLRKKMITLAQAMNTGAKASGINGHYAQAFRQEVQYHQVLDLIVWITKEVPGLLDLPLKDVITFSILETEKLNGETDEIRLHHD